MKLRAQFTQNARADLLELKEFVLQQWSQQAWKAAFAEIRHAVATIESHPEAGAICPDLAAIGITAYRQILTSKNRIIYEADKDANLIFVHVVCDQRRDLQTLLMRRLLRASGSR
ncbi:type II toxin-antitoxin system RelE/ParE family toxin [Massilia glaciei]|uniref:Type II toxin-antitoxin system RelE/ParE family toxin n=1 Tax=Massilia glaciei TaxID=1524097 RepID=A0A2U2HJS0_9BURK|nr:type II toxin-antitoxin system RelE/ParE family toxin [Massilia glaciei]PWF47777.1 type II toxin-antitoxin system RelE/ParE family toxin [Massilia glaciei]